MWRSLPRSGIVTHKDVAEAQRITDDIGDGRSRLGARSNLSERSRAGIAVDCLVSAEADKYVVSTHLRGIAEEEEGARHKGDIEEIIACAAEYLLGEYHRESHRDGYHPAWSVDRAYHRNQYAGHKESFLDFMSAYLGHDELYAKSHNVCRQYLGQHCQKSVEEEAEKLSRRIACGHEML